MVLKLKPERRPLMGLADISVCSIVINAKSHFVVKSCEKIKCCITKIARFVDLKSAMCLRHPNVTFILYTSMHASVDDVNFRDGPKFVYVK